jgi:hypothetical protein
MKILNALIIVVGFLLISIQITYSQSPADSLVNENLELSSNDKLVVLWTSGDPEVAEKMVFMYTYNAMKQNWWKDITFIVWGPSSKLLSENKSLQEYIMKMMKVGVRVEACKACADMYGVSDKLSDLGINVRYLGEPLTEYIKQGRHVITF